ncbi:MAG TPA: PspC domain-containing protein [Nocardioidaceae bacterium]|nr:PspC domain-containing protein [Nocardioidaceae bacterium]
MTETPQQDRVDPDRVRTENLRDYTQLRRSTTDRKIAGVAGGLGRHLNIDPTILRVVLVVLCFFGGAGFVLYGAAWLLVPEHGEETGNVATSAGTRNALLITAAVFAALLFVGDSWGGFGFPWPLAVIALIVLVVLMSRDKPVSTQASPLASPLAPSMTAPTQQSYVPPAPQQDRGPKLFWFTLAMVAIALGSLGLYESAGGAVTDAAYPALALTVVGAMLVLGAWVGRAGGLILLGVVAAFALAITGAVVPRFDGDREIDVTPTQVSQVQDNYYVPAGSIHVDLSDIDDIDTLDGRRIDIGANAGEIVVTVPEGVNLEVTADVSVGGEATVVGQEGNGPNVNIERRIPAGPDAPDLELDIHLLVGSISVNQELGQS